MLLEADQVSHNRSTDLDRETRRERDLLGEADVPANAYWGIHTLRAIENFTITGVPVGKFPELVRSLSLVKQAAARASRRPGNLPAAKADAIDQACDRIVKDGRHGDQFLVDAVQGGAGTSTNMNANEVVANVALEILGKPKGDYASLHPNDDVNMAQSTNDAYPTALRLAIIFATYPLIRTLEELAYAFKAKAVEFADVLKLGRTQLQDAVPMTLGQEFDAYFVAIKEDVSRLNEAVGVFRAINLGATAIGTGITTDARYSALVVEELSRLSQQSLVPAANMIEATWDMGPFVLFSGVLKHVAAKLSKISNDLRLLSSGPFAGFGEIHLPAMQAGSSIMPGKVNPVIPRGRQSSRLSGDRAGSDGYDVRRRGPVAAQCFRADDRILSPIDGSLFDGGCHDVNRTLCEWNPTRPRTLSNPGRLQRAIGDCADTDPRLRQGLTGGKARSCRAAQGR